MKKVWLFLVLVVLAMMVHFGVNADNKSYLLPEEPECQWEYNINHIVYDWEGQYATKIWVKNLSYDKVAHVRAELLWDKQTYNIQLQPRERIAHTFYAMHDARAGELTIWSDQKLAINVLVWGVCDGNHRMSEVFVHETSECPAEVCEEVTLECPACPSLTCPDVIVPPCPSLTCPDPCPGECEEECQNECRVCQGKATELTLKYNGSIEATIQVDQKKEGTIFNELVSVGGEFTVFGSDKKNTLGTEISLYVDDVLNTKIHTSCSDLNVGPGFVSGVFEVIEGFSREGGLLCPTPE